MCFVCLVYLVSGWVCGYTCVCVYVLVLGNWAGETTTTAMDEHKHKHSPGTGTSPGVASEKGDPEGLNYTSFLHTYVSMLQSGVCSRLNQLPSETVKSRQTLVDVTDNLHESLDSTARHDFGLVTKRNTWVKQSAGPICKFRLECNLASCFYTYGKPKHRKYNLAHPGLFKPQHLSHQQRLVLMKQQLAHTFGTTESTVDRLHFTLAGFSHTVYETLSALDPPAAAVQLPLRTVVAQLRERVARNPATTSRSWADTVQVFDLEVQWLERVVPSLQNSRCGRWAGCDVGQLTWPGLLARYYQCARLRCCCLSEALLQVPTYAGLVCCGLPVLTPSLCTRFAWYEGRVAIPAAEPERQPWGHPGQKLLLQRPRPPPPRIGLGLNTLCIMENLVAAVELHRRVWNCELPQALVANQKALVGAVRDTLPLWLGYNTNVLIAQVEERLLLLPDLFIQRSVLTFRLLCSSERLYLQDPLQRFEELLNDPAWAVPSGAHQEHQQQQDPGPGWPALLVRQLALHGVDPSLRSDSPAARLCHQHFEPHYPPQQYSPVGLYLSDHRTGVPPSSPWYDRWRQLGASGVGLLSTSAPEPRRHRGPPESAGLDTWIHQFRTRADLLWETFALLYSQFPAAELGKATLDMDRLCARLALFVQSLLVLAARPAPVLALLAQHYRTAAALLAVAQQRSQAVAVRLARNWSQLHTAFDYQPPSGLAPDVGRDQSVYVTLVRRCFSSLCSSVAAVADRCIHRRTSNRHWLLMCHAFKKYLLTTFFKQQLRVMDDFGWQQSLSQLVDALQRLRSALATELSVAAGSHKDSCVQYSPPGGGLPWSWALVPGSLRVPRLPAASAGALAGWLHTMRQRVAGYRQLFRGGVAQELRRFGMASDHACYAQTAGARVCLDPRPPTKRIQRLGNPNTQCLCNQWKQLWRASAHSEQKDQEQKQEQKQQQPVPPRPGPDVVGGLGVCKTEFVAAYLACSSSTRELQPCQTCLIHTVYWDVLEHTWICYLWEVVFIALVRMVAGKPV